MKKGYYIFCGSQKDLEKGSLGVVKKMQRQVDVLNNYFETNFITITEPKNYHRGIIDKIMLRVPNVSFPRDYIQAISYMDSPDFIYIRGTIADKKFIEFLSMLRSNFPNCKIIIELFTYPYEKDTFDSWIMKPLMFKDRIYRKFYKKLIDRFTTYSLDKEIFGVPTINIMNGINAKDVEPIMPSRYDVNTLHLVFVGYMQKQHGLERLLYGLYNYYCKSTKKNVIFHMVGDGPELDKYEAIVDKLCLSDYVIVYGSKHGKELDDIYNQADLGVDALSLYKSGINWSSSLKSREYLAKGLPIVSGCRTDVFEKYKCDYHVDFANDASPIDVEKIISWYNDLSNQYVDKVEMTKAIHAYAVNHVDSSVVIKPVVDYIYS
ncbi:glycosyltransferase [Selenomonas ruminantium]|uniref:Glycosyl transferases group 1 n=1 Tax=Selenomonas ruminantium TaxID=971 RepID=A0A1H0PNA6_SELRU|nr:glycosyltransferase [Selenomonas ruminantium]SDP06597.1 Glycosyl transferases group 1 [Selenomonas ruminantium]